MFSFNPSAISSSSISSSSVSSFPSKKVHLKTWEECKTLPEKIGFIMGQAIPKLCIKLGDGIKSAAKFCQLDRAAQGCQNAFSSCFDATRSCTQKTRTAISTRFDSMAAECASNLCHSRVTLYVQKQTPSFTCTRLNNCCEGVLTKAARICKYINQTCSDLSNRISLICKPCTNGIRTCWNRLTQCISDSSFRANNGCLKPCWNRAVANPSSWCSDRVNEFMTSLRKKASNLCRRVSEFINNSCSKVTDLYNATVTPFYNKRISPICERISSCFSSIYRSLSDRISSCAEWTFNNICVRANDYTLKPLYNKCIAPCVTNTCNGIGEFFSAFCGGLCGKIEEDDVEPQVDERVLKAIETLKNSDEFTTDDAALRDAILKYARENRMEYSFSMSTNEDGPKTIYTFTKALKTSHKTVKLVNTN